MMNPWKLYDLLIGGIPEHLTVKDYQICTHWSRVTSSEDSIGLGMVISTQSRPVLCTDSLINKPLRDAAALVKSWDFVEASVGLAAINSYYNQPDRARQCGFAHPKVTEKMRDAFDVYFEEVEGKKIAVVGHFPFLDRFDGHCEISILEQNPSYGDYPDSACEYILAQQDYVFITGCTLVNKTFPRLLSLSENAKVVMVGPSTPLAPTLFDQGVFGLSGLVVTEAAQLIHALRGADNMGLFLAGTMVDQMKCKTKPNAQTEQWIHKT